MVEPRPPPLLLLLTLCVCPATATLYATLGVTALSPPGDDWLWVNSALYGYGSPLSSATGILRAATGDRFGCSPKLTKFWPELPGSTGNSTANSGQGGASPTAGGSLTAVANSTVNSGQGSASSTVNSGQGGASPTANSGQGGASPTASGNLTAVANSTVNSGHGGGASPTANSGHGWATSGGGGGAGGAGGGGGGVMWIALVQRGNCTFNAKVQVAQSLHASGLLVVNSQEYTVEAMALGDGVRIPTLMITGERGLFLERLLGGSEGAVQKGVGGGPLPAPQRGGVLLEVQVTPGETFTPSMRTPVVFVSSAFAVVVVASVAWAAFYYGRRARAGLAVARAKRKLECLAKTGISRLDHKTIKPADKEMDAEFDPCAVCIEGYKAGEVVRILPCKHEFHRSCVDPWLLQHRTCPMCKLNILKALGLADEEAEVEVVAGGGGPGGGLGGGAGGGAGGGVATDPSGGLVTPVPTSTTNPVAMETDSPPNSPTTPHPACS